MAKHKLTSEDKQYIKMLVMLSKQHPEGLDAGLTYTFEHIVLKFREEMDEVFKKGLFQGMKRR